MCYVGVTCLISPIAKPNTNEYNIIFITLQKYILFRA